MVPNEFLTCFKDFYTFGYFFEFFLKVVRRMPRCNEIIVYHLPRREEEEEDCMDIFVKAILPLANVFTLFMNSSGKKFMKVLNMVRAYFFL